MRAIFMGDEVDDPQMMTWMQAHILTKEFGADPDYWLNLPSERWFVAWEHHMLLEGRRNPD